MYDTSIASHNGFKLHWEREWQKAVQIPTKLFSALRSYNVYSGLKESGKCNEIEDQSKNRKTRGCIGRWLEQGEWCSKCVKLHRARKWWANYWVTEREDWTKRFRSHSVLHWNYWGLIILHGGWKILRNILASFLPVRSDVLSLPWQECSHHALDLT